MKKVYFLLSILFFCFSFATSAFATSGACSYHGGVSCSAGSDYDGSVICNDGWRDSSVNYSDMVECASHFTPAPSVAVAPTNQAPVVNISGSGSCSDHGGVNCLAGPDYDGSVICTDGWSDSSVQYFSVAECRSTPMCSPSELTQLQTKYDVKGTIQKMVDAANALPTGIVHLEGQGDVMTLLTGRQAVLQQQGIAQIEALKTIAHALQLSINEECYSLGAAEEIQRQAQAQSDIQSAQNQINDLQNQIDNRKKTSCLALGNSYFNDNNECHCSSGYVLGQPDGVPACITYTKSCTDTFGQNVLGTADPVSRYKSSSSNKDFDGDVMPVCKCTDGFVWNKSGTTCTSSVQQQALSCAAYGLNSYLTSDKTCRCSQGYEWSAAQTFCVASTTQNVAPNKPTDFYVYDYSKGVKGKLLKDIKFDSSKTQSVKIPSNNVLIEWTVADADLTAKQKVYFNKGAAADWCGGGPYSAVKDKIKTTFEQWNNCRDGQFKKVTVNRVTRTSMKVNAAYVFEYTYQDKTNPVGSSYMPFSLVPTRTSIFKIQKR